MGLALAAQQAYFMAKIRGIPKILKNLVKSLLAEIVNKKTNSYWAGLNRLYGCHAHPTTTPFIHSMLLPSVKLMVNKNFCELSNSMFYQNRKKQKIIHEKRRKKKRWLDTVQ